MRDVLAIGPRILIVVDDDEAFFFSIERAFATNHNIALWVVTSADEAVQHLGRHAVDVAVVDVLVPGVDGIAVCRRLRAAAPALRVMMATEHLTAEVLEAALRAGASRVLQKPFGVARLVAASSSSTDEAARRGALIEAHLELARNIAGRLARSYQALLAPDEIEALARLGLCEAASRFDSARAEPFLAFAERRIRGAVMDEVRRLGAHTRGGQVRMRRITEARRALERTHGEPGDADVAAHLGMTPEEVARAQAPTRAVFAPLDDDCASPEEPPDQLAEQTEALALVAHGRRALSPLGQAIIAMHYDEEMSFGAIAKALGIGIGRVMQLHARSLESLRREVARGPREPS
jgi:RNA polymerase sigma factor FliA